MKAVRVANIIVLLAHIVGCSPAEEARLVLSNGAQVQLTEGGGLELLVDERAVFALADGAAPTVRTFEDRHSGSLAIFSFRRVDEAIHALERRGTPERRDDSVIVELRGDDGQWSGTLTFTADTDESTRVELAVDGEGTSLALPLRCGEEATFHGFGEQYNATDQRGEAFELIVSEQGIGRNGLFRQVTGDAHTTYFPMPYYLDARGFGGLIETGRRVEADLCSSDPRVAWLEVISGEPLSMIIFHGPTPLDVIRQLGDRLGRPAPLPEWAFGLWVGAQGGRDEVLAEADRLDASDVPYQALWVQDWTGTRMNIDGGFGVQYRWVADEALYPDLAGMIDELHQRGHRFLGYANPFVDADLDDHFPEMEARGLLVRDPISGDAYVFGAPNGSSSHPDLTNPEARAYVADALRAMVEGYGMDGWMVDFGEWLPIDVAVSDGTDAMVAHNRYPIEWQQVNRDVLEAARPDGDWVMFARSGWSGVQGSAQIHWAGDQEADFSETDGLPTVVPALLNLGIAGQPNVTHDIGGFSGGPRTKEVFMRWVELGAFTPIMRTHEGNKRLENWSWDGDEETTAHFRRFVRIHDALAPDFAALADEAQQSSAPVLRHLMLVFPDDPATYGISDQFMIGDELLVAPVLHEGEQNRSLYLPRGTWYHVWTGERYEGGETIDVDAPLGSPPVFSRDRDREDLRAIE